MKKFLSLAMALMMVMSLLTVTTSAADFTDSDEIDYGLAVDVVSTAGIISGYEDGSLGPNGTLTRGAAAKIICNMVLGPTTASALSADTAPFPDVPTNHTYAGYVAYCSQQGIISGYPDGTFRPGNSLSGYAFMKMLLGALGYQSDREGYTGANWTINVAKRALSIGLDDDLKEETPFVGTATVTRQEAMLYAFNTLQADMVDYNLIANIGGVIVGGDKATPSGQGTYPNNMGDPVTLQFAERYFPKMERIPRPDDMGRPGSDWKYDKKFIGTESDTPDVVYFTKVKNNAVYDDLDLEGNTNFYYYIDGVNGESSGMITVQDDKNNMTYSRDGVVIELYKDLNNNGWEASATTNRAVIIYPEIVKITSVGDDNGGRFIKTQNGYKYYTDDFAKGDYVEVYVDRSATAADKKITYIKLAEKVTGEVTKITGREYTVDGEPYTAGDGADFPGGQTAFVPNGGTPPAKGDTIDMWLSTYGYVLRTAISESNVSLDELALVLKTGEDRNGWARLLFADGTKKTVDTDKNYDSTYDLAKIVRFEVDGSEYELTAQDPTTYYGSTSQYYFTSGTTTLINEDGSGSLNVDSKTVFVIADPNNNYSAKAYVGYKNAPSFGDKGTNNADIVAYKRNSSDKALTLVYALIDDLYVHTDTDDVIFFVPKLNGYDKTFEKDKSDYYQVAAVVKGEFKWLNVKAGAATADVDGVSFYGSIPGAVVKEIKTNSDGQITGVTNESRSLVLAAANAQTDGLSYDTLIFNSVAYAIDDDTKVYVVPNNRKSVTEISIEDIAEDKNNATNGTDPYEAILLAWDDDKILTNVVLIETDN